MKSERLYVVQHCTYENYWHTLGKHSSLVGAMNQVVDIIKNNNINDLRIVECIDEILRRVVEYYPNLPSYDAEQWFGSS